MMRRILVPLDGSELAESVLPYVKDLARGLHAKVHLVRVVEVTVPPELLVYGTAPLGTVEAMLQAEEATRKKAEDYLSRMTEHIQADGLDVSWAVVNGGAAEKIVDAAYSERADLIAMSTNGRLGRGRMIPGGVVDEVLHNAVMPVLLVKSG